MYLIVGLGNPGKQYKLTRHNIGYLVIDRLSRIYGVDFRKRKLYLYSIFHRDDSHIIIAKPTTYMNLSGNAVRALIDYYHIDIRKILVVVDDINLPLGKIRLREKGSDGGHNGLSSIIQSLHTNEFSRLRVGIGSDHPLDNMVNFVLSEFNSRELSQLDDIVETCVEAIGTYLDEGFTFAMNRYN